MGVLLAVAQSLLVISTMRNSPLTDPHDAKITSLCWRWEALLMVKREVSPSPCFCNPAPGYIYNCDTSHIVIYCFSTPHAILAPVISEEKYGKITQGVASLLSPLPHRWTDLSQPASISFAKSWEAMMACSQRHLKTGGRTPDLTNCYSPSLSDPAIHIRQIGLLWELFL